MIETRDDPHSLRSKTQRGGLPSDAYSRLWNGDKACDSTLYKCEAVRKTIPSQNNNNKTISKTEAQTQRSKNNTSRYKTGFYNPKPVLSSSGLLLRWLWLFWGSCSNQSISVFKICFIIDQHQSLLVPSRYTVLLKQKSFKTYSA